MTAAAKARELLAAAHDADRQAEKDFTLAGAVEERTKGIALRLEALVFLHLDEHEETEAEPEGVGETMEVS